MMSDAFHGPYSVQNTRLKAILRDKDGQTVLMTPDFAACSKEAQAALLWTLAQTAEILNQAEGLAEQRCTVAVV